ncbi:PAS domain S-box protein, partial [bacterium]|nr:PAS domain S-box protein [bacterium]
MRDEKKTKARLIAELNELRGELTAGASGGGHPILFDRIPLGLFRCTRRGELLWANRTLAGTLGYEDPEGLTGIKLRSLFVHPRLRGDLFDRLKVGEGSEGYLAELKRSDGGTFRARLTVQPDPRVGEGAEVFDGLVEDLTGEREFEETLARRVKHSAVLATLSRELYAAETVQEVLEVAVERLAEIFPTYASVNLVEEHRRYLTIRAHRVASGILRFGERISGRRLANLKIPLYEDTVIAETIHSGHPTVCGLGFEPEEPVVETDLRTLVEALVEAKSPLRRFGAEIAEMVGDVAFLGIPFTDSAGEVTGSITVLSNLLFAPDEYNLIKVSADIVGKALEQKRLSQELGESLERYRGVFLNTVLGIYRTTPDGRVLMANPALVRMLGYDTFEELSKRNLEKGYQPGYSRADFKRVVEEKGEIHGEESVWTRLDGTSLHVHENTRAVRDEKGKTLYYEGTVEDITERKRAEEDRDKHLREIRALFEGVYILLWSVREGADGELYYEQVNDAFAAVEGYTPDHYNGKPIADLHPPEECENIRNSFNWAKLGKIHTSEVHFGEGVDQRFFEIRIIPLTDPDGEIRRFIGAGSDITERKLAEEALRESEERYHSFWVNAPVGICLSDSHGRLTMVSPVLCAMTGYPEEELLGMELFELIAEGDERAVPIAKTMDTHEFEQLQSLFSGGPTELTLVKKDGGLLPVEFNIDFITEKGTLKYMITL